ncbi:MAG: 50S ribosomal protein L15 [Planctomycetes bacterium]|nr:50S ribosomal protein L15 [Planctomycetota bacterium]
MDLTELNSNVKKKKARKRVGRGNASGWGCTAGTGANGQKSRAGYSRRLGFEGGQMPLFRKLPKRGFNNKIFKKVFIPINVDMLKRFDDGSVVKIEDYKNFGIVKKYADGIKILGGGEIDRKLTVTAHKFSASARKKIEAAGGKCIELIPSEKKEDKAKADKSKVVKPKADEKKTKPEAAKPAVKKVEEKKESKKADKTNVKQDDKPSEKKEIIKQEKPTEKKVKAEKPEKTDKPKKADNKDKGEDKKENKDKDDKK